MIRKFLFSSFGFLMLSAAVASAATVPAPVSHCNDSWCDRYGGSGSCMEGFPGTHCMSGGGSCLDDMCI